MGFLSITSHLAQPNFQKKSYLRFRTNLCPIRVRDSASWRCSPDRQSTMRLLTKPMQTWEAFWVFLRTMSSYGNTEVHINNFLQYLWTWERRKLVLISLLVSGVKMQQRRLLSLTLFIKLGLLLKTKSLWLFQVLMRSLSVQDPTTSSIVITRPFMELSSRAPSTGPKLILESLW